MLLNNFKRRFKVQVHGYLRIFYFAVIKQRAIVKFVLVGQKRRYGADKIIIRAVGCCKLPALQHPNGGAVLTQQAVVNGVWHFAAVRRHNAFYFWQVGCINHIFNIAAGGNQHFCHTFITGQFVQSFINVHCRIIFLSHAAF